MKSVITSFFIILFLFSFNPVSAMDTDTGKMEIAIPDKQKQSPIPSVSPDSKDVEARGYLAGPRANSIEPRAGVDDFYVGCEGSFHGTGERLSAIYIFDDIFYDSGWSFRDNKPVSGRTGWTYKEDGFRFFMFFSKSPGYGPCVVPPQLFQLMYSPNNRDFFHFDCTR